MCNRRQGWKNMFQRGLQRKNHVLYFNWSLISSILSLSMSDGLGLSTKVPPEHFKVSQFMHSLTPECDKGVELCKWLLRPPDLSFDYYPCVCSSMQRQELKKPSKPHMGDMKAQNDGQVAYIYMIFFCNYQFVFRRIFCFIINLSNCQTFIYFCVTWKTLLFGF